MTRSATSSSERPHTCRTSTSRPLRSVRAEQIVFTQRLDSLILRGKPLTAHVAGVFEVDAEGKIAVWRDYFDSGEVAVQVGADGFTPAGKRTSTP